MTAPEDNGWAFVDLSPHLPGARMRERRPPRADVPSDPASGAKINTKGTAVPGAGERPTILRVRKKATKRPANNAHIYRVSWRYERWVPDEWRIRYCGWNGARALVERVSRYPGSTWRVERCNTPTAELDWQEIPARFKFLEDRDHGG